MLLNGLGFAILLLGQGPKPEPFPETVPPLEPVKLPISKPLPQNPVATPATPQTPTNPLAPLQPEQPEEPKEVGKRITVDLKTQSITAYQDGEPVYIFICSTGRGGLTPKGIWPVREKRAFNRALPKYGSVPIPWSLRLDIVTKGGRQLIAIHAHNSVPRYPASHGCIRLRYDDARRMFDWADVGVKVTVE